MRWYIEAQHAVCQRSWLADSGRLHLQPWRMAAYLDAWSTATRKLAVAFLCWQRIHLLRSTNIQAKAMRGWQRLSQVQAVTLTALRRKDHQELATCTLDGHLVELRS